MKFYLIGCETGSGRSIRFVVSGTGREEALRKGRLSAGKLGDDILPDSVRIIMRV